MAHRDAFGATGRQTDPRGIGPARPSEPRPVLRRPARSGAQRLLTGPSHGRPTRWSGTEDQRLCSPAETLAKRERNRRGYRVLELQLKFRKRRERGQQCREVIGDRRPQNVEIDVEVVMNQAVAHPRRGRPCTVGYSERVSVLTCFAASPTISTSLVSARRSTSSSLRSSRVLPDEYSSALDPASSR